jgi:hypothetical protein
MKRRTLLQIGGAAAASALALRLVFDSRRAHGRSRLEPDPERLLDLHPGLHYRVVDRAFDSMSDGFRVPARPDGMACFPGPSSTWVLMRNHELDRVAALGPFRAGVPAEAYDPHCVGGVTRVVLDSKTLERVSSNLVLAGTLRNCGGGPSPWGWLSCEEAVDPGHGYVFLCRTTATSLSRPERVAAYGRFNHEAVCIDPRTNVAYLTEDRGDGCLYRFVPKDPNRPFAGKLQAMARTGAPGYVTSESMAQDGSVEVSWVDVGEAAPEQDTLRLRAHERGAALVSRGEGIWFERGSVYVCSTDGGRAGRGQIFKLTPKGAERGVFELLAESAGEDMLDRPDNICVAPWGDVYLAEDGSGEQYVRALTPTGNVVDIARNARSGGEFAGVCLSPDASTLFLNFQHEGITLAVRGPLRDATREG